MTIRALLVCVSICVGAACTHPGGKVLGDTMAYDKATKKWVPFMDYAPPNIDDLTGIDSEATPPEPEPPAPMPPAAVPAPAPAATVAPVPAKPAIATPAPSPSKPGGATPAKK